MRRGAESSLPAAATQPAVGHQETQTPRADKLPWRKRTGVRVAGALAVPVFGLGIGGCSSSGETTPPPGSGIESPAVPGQQAEPENTRFEQREKQARAEIEKIGTEAALSILDDLDNPNSGAENYMQTKVGNKKAIVGPDLEMDTPDDSQYPSVMPEMLASLDPDTGTIFIRSVSGHGRGDDSTFFAAETAFRVSLGSEIATNPNQLTTADFRSAIEARDTEFLAASFNNGGDYDENTQLRPEGEHYAISVAGPQIVEARELDTSLFVSGALKGEPIEITPYKSNTNAVDTIDGLNAATYSLGEISGAVTTQLRKDTSAGN